MRPEEFQGQMDRLIEQFGKKNYADVRVKLIWREVKDLGAYWWEQLVDRFLLTCRQPPLYDELYEEISRERERIYRDEKEKHAKDAKDFYEGTYQPEEVRLICQTIIKRLNHEVSDEYYEKFKEHLTYAAKRISRVVPISNCKHCEGSGLVFIRDADHYEWVYRCLCEMGMRKPKAYPIYRPTQQLKRGG